MALSQKDFSSSSGELRNSNCNYAQWKCSVQTKKLYKCDEFEIPDLSVISESAGESAIFNSKTVPKSAAYDVSPLHAPCKEYSSPSLCNKSPLLVEEINKVSLEEVDEFIPHTKIDTINLPEKSPSCPEHYNGLQITEHILDTVLPQPKYTSRKKDLPLSDLTNKQTSFNNQIPGNSRSSNLDVSNVFPNSDRKISSHNLIGVNGDILDNVNELNKKMFALQNQITTLQQNKPCHALEISGKENPCFNESDTQKHYNEVYAFSENSPQHEKSVSAGFIIRYLKDYNDRLKSLENQVDFLKNNQDQTHLLIKRIEQLELIHLNKSDLSSKGPELHCCTNVVKHSSTVDKNCQTNENEICHEKTQTKKTSTSTMTSLTFDGKDRLEYCKQLTVVTKCQEDVVHHSSLIKCTEPKEVAVDIDSPKMQNETSSKRERNSASKSADSKKLSKKPPKPAKGSSNKNKKCGCQYDQQGRPIDLNAECNPGFQDGSPQLRMNGAAIGKQIDHTRGNKFHPENPSPVYGNIVKNINQLNLEEDNETSSKPSSEEESRQKHNPQLNKCRKGKCKTCSPISPSKKKKSGAANGRQLNHTRRHQFEPDKVPSPVYGNIVKNINQLRYDDDDEASSKPSSSEEKYHKCNPKPSTSYKNKCKSCSPISPTKRRLKYGRSSSVSSSDCSTDLQAINEETDSDNHYKKDLFNRPSATSEYGIRSPLLSVATKEYLERYDLHQSKNSADNCANKTRISKKSKASRRH